jgi:hypothetical protein
MSEDERLEECFMDLLNQSIGTYQRDKDYYLYDHMCISTYESALRLALDFGWIKEEQLTRKL